MPVLGGRLRFPAMRTPQGHLIAVLFLALALLNACVSGPGVSASWRATEPPLSIKGTGQAASVQVTDGIRFYIHQTKPTTDWVYMGMLVQVTGQYKEDVAKEVKARGGDIAVREGMNTVGSSWAVLWAVGKMAGNPAPSESSGTLTNHPKVQGVPTESERKFFQETKAKAETGNAEAQYIVGACYNLGKCVSEDFTEAVKWYRKAADQGNANAQTSLGFAYAEGKGVPKDEAEAVKWYRKATDQEDLNAQTNLGLMYVDGRGVPKDEVEAVKWYRRAADQGHSNAQFNLGLMYDSGRGVPKDEVEAVKWYRKAADQGHDAAQVNLGFMYYNGNGVIKDEVEAYKWLLLSGAQGTEMAKGNLPKIERKLSAEQRAEGQRLAREWKPQKPITSGNTQLDPEPIKNIPKSTGTGFFITDDGYLITNQHVAGEGATVRVLTAAGTISAKVVKVDKANDIALLKAQGNFTALPVIASRSVRLGAVASTVGFPNTGLQGFSPKLAKGDIASLAGAQDDARHFQISVPIQPGNSGGALVDERGNVIGVVVAVLNQKAAIATSGTLAQNVNYAVKSSYLLSFLEAVPAVAEKLKEPNTKDRKFEDVVKDVERAAVLVLVY